MWPLPQGYIKMKFHLCRGFIGDNLNSRFYEIVRAHVNVNLCLSLLENGFTRGSDWILSDTSQRFWERFSQTCFGGRRAFLKLTGRALLFLFQCKKRTNKQTDKKKEFDQNVIGCCVDKGRGVACWRVPYQWHIRRGGTSCGG